MHPNRSPAIPADVSPNTSPSLSPFLTGPTTPSDRPHVLSEAECRALVQRLAALARGGGRTTVRVSSSWTGYARWARNRITTSDSAADGMVRATNGLDVSTVGTRWKLMCVWLNCGQMKFA